MDDRLLVKRAKRGDVDAFAELYGKIYEKLYRFAFYMLKNAQDAEDAVSEAVTDAFEGIRGLKREESFANWMYQIVANKCRRKMREYCRRTVSLDQKQSGEEGDYARKIYHFTCGIHICIFICFCFGKIPRYSINIHTNSRNFTCEINWLNLYITKTFIIDSGYLFFLVNFCSTQQILIRICTSYCYNPF